MLECMKKALLAILATFVIHAVCFAALAAPRMNAAPRAHRSGKVATLAPSAMLDHSHAAPRAMGASVVSSHKAAPAKPRAMVCARARLLDTSTFQTVKICEYR